MRGGWGTSGFFHPAKNLLSFRNFVVVADDEEVDFGEPVPLTADLEPLPFKRPLFSDERMQVEIQKPTERTLSRT